MLVTVRDPESNPSTIGDSQVNSLLPVMASYGNLPVANAHDSALSSGSASFVINSSAQRSVKLRKDSTLEKKKEDTGITGDSRTKHDDL